MKNSVASRQSRANLQGSAKDQWLNLSITSGGSSKTSETSEKHIGICTVGAGDWLVHNIEPNTDCDFVNYQTQHHANLMHQPETVIRTTSIVEPSMIDHLPQTGSSNTLLQPLCGFACCRKTCRSAEKRCPNEPSRQNQSQYVRFV